MTFARQGWYMFYPCLFCYYSEIKLLTLRMCQRVADSSVVLEVLGIFPSQHRFTTWTTDARKSTTWQAVSRRSPTTRLEMS